MLEHAVDAALEREADDDVGPVGGGELRNDVREKRVVAARDEVALGSRCRSDVRPDSFRGQGSRVEPRRAGLERRPGSAE